MGIHVDEVDSFGRKGFVLSESRLRTSFLRQRWEPPACESPSHPTGRTKLFLFQFLGKFYCLRSILQREAAPVSRCSRWKCWWLWIWCRQQLGGRVLIAALIASFVFFVSGPLCEVGFARLEGSKRSCHNCGCSELLESFLCVLDTVQGSSLTSKYQSFLCNGNVPLQVHHREILARVSALQCWQ